MFFALSCSLYLSSVSLRTISLCQSRGSTPSHLFLWLLPSHLFAVPASGFTILQGHLCPASEQTCINVWFCHWFTRSICITCKSQSPPASVTKSQAFGPWTPLLGFPHTHTHTQHLCSGAFLCHFWPQAFCPPYSCLHLPGSAYPSSTSHLLHSLRCLSCYSKQNAVFFSTTIISFRISWEIVCHSTKLKGPDRVWIEFSPVCLSRGNPA